MARGEEARTTTSCEKNIDGTSDYHAFIDFCGTRFQTRNSSLFDTQGVQPIWTHVKSGPWTSYDLCIAHRQIVLQGAFRPQERGLTRKTQPTSDRHLLATSYRQDDLLALATDFPPNTSHTNSFTKVALEPVLCEGMAEAKEMEYYMKGFQSGSQIGLRTQNLVHDANPLFVFAPLDTWHGRKFTLVCADNTPALSFLLLLMMVFHSHNSRDGQRTTS